SCANCKSSFWNDFSNIKPVADAAVPFLRCCSLHDQQPEQSQYARDHHESHTATTIPDPTQRRPRHRETPERPTARRRRQAQRRTKRW
ncbi:hypothetical protein M9458_012238, partial [Cirrhinus mrigala]